MPDPQSHCRCSLSVAFMNARYRRCIQPPGAVRAPKLTDLSKPLTWRFKRAPRTVDALVLALLQLGHVLGAKPSGPFLNKSDADIHRHEPGPRGVEGRLHDCADFGFCCSVEGEVSVALGSTRFGSRGNKVGKVGSDAAVGLFSAFTVSAVVGRQDSPSDQSSVRVRFLVCFSSINFLDSRSDLGPVVTEDLGRPLSVSTLEDCSGF